MHFTYYLLSKISELKAKKSLLFVRHGLRFDEAQAEITMHFNITDGREEVKVESGKGASAKEHSLFVC